MNFHILTLFPEMVLSGLNTSITGRAIQQNKIQLEAVNIRDFTEDKHGRVDDYTYGGGAGMLMQAQPVYDAFCSVESRMQPESKRRVIYVTPQGQPFTQSLAEELAKSDDLVLLCGHYEGIDERVLEEIVTDYISIGDYVLTGGELAAMVIVDAVSRLVPDVLHNETSAETESFHGNLLEYPQYSRPEVWHGKQVPAVLLSGNQKEIDKWRRLESEKRTRERRPDLYETYRALEDCKELLLRKKLHHMDMIELIHRGRAVLVAQQGDEILLEDSGSHILYHTWLRDERQAKTDSSATLLHRLKELGKDRAPGIVLHQREFVEVLEHQGYHLERECMQAVCTRREQLPITGLYALNGSVPASGIHIEELPSEAFSQICPGVEEPESARSSMEKGMVYGAFLEESLAGVIGILADGSIGMLEVLPEYRRRKVALALETYACNRLLSQGLTPYGQITVGNEAALALQEKLGLCVAKENIFWLEK